MSAEQATNPSNGWIDASKELPAEGKYVIAHVTVTNWRDAADPTGVQFDVVALRRGLSLSDREKMRSGELPDPDGRSRIRRRGDEGENNKRAYVWEPFGPGYYEGQEVDYWMSIPELNPA